MICISTLFAGSVFDLKMEDKLSVDFLTGFESGLFMRNDTKEFIEYGCPTKVIESKETAMLK